MNQYGAFVGDTSTENIKYLAENVARCYNTHKKSKIDGPVIENRSFRRKSRAVFPKYTQASRKKMWRKLQEDSLDEGD
jgi:hypothetical protein